MEPGILSQRTILVVDDEEDLREIIASELDYLGAQVIQAGSVKAAKKALGKSKIDLVISDIRMPGGTGIELLDFVKKNIKSLPVILITGFADITADEARNRGALALVNKPFQLDSLMKMVEKGLVS